MSKIDFDKIIEENTSSIFMKQHPSSVQTVKNIMKQACIQVLDEAAERAITKLKLQQGKEMPHRVVDKQSILKIKEEL